MYFAEILVNENVIVFCLSFYKEFGDIKLSGDHGRWLGSVGWDLWRVYAYVI